jgi:16S rRNA (guanine(966)-N(2))-methyltransferase RsmD
LGIEALSRGAARAYFADNNPKALAIVKENLERAKLSEKARVNRLPYDAFLRLAKDKFGIVFLDPPYRKGLCEKSLKLLSGKTKSGGIVICEHEKQLRLPERVEKLKVENVYNYGSTDVTIYRKTEV